MQNRACSCPLPIGGAAAEPGHAGFASPLPRSHVPKLFVPGAANKLFLPGLAPQGSAPFCLAAPGPRTSRGMQCRLAGLSRLALGTWGWRGGSGCPVASQEGPALPQQRIPQLGCAPSAFSPSSHRGGMPGGGSLLSWGVCGGETSTAPDLPCPEAGSGPPGTGILGCSWVSAPRPQLSPCPLFRLPPLLPPAPVTWSAALQGGGHGRSRWVPSPGCWKLLFLPHSHPGAGTGQPPGSGSPLPLQGAAGRAAVPGQCHTRGAGVGGALPLPGASP